MDSTFCVTVLIAAVRDAALQMLALETFVGEKQVLLLPRTRTEWAMQSDDRRMSTGVE